MSTLPYSPKIYLHTAPSIHKNVHPTTITPNIPSLISETHIFRMGIKNQVFGRKSNWNFHTHVHTHTHIDTHTYTHTTTQIHLKTCRRASSYEIYITDISRRITVNITDITVNAKDIILRSPFTWFRELCEFKWKRRTR